jgi:hypothetical protein
MGLLLLAACFYTSCANYKLNLEQTAKDWSSHPMPEKKLDFKVYLIGDAGTSGVGKRSAALQLLSQELREAPKESAVIFLGNNAIPDGLPKKKQKHHDLAEHELKAQLDILKGYKGQVIFLPGNYDWAADGVDGVRRQQKFVEEYLGRSDVFLPGDACSGPEIRELTSKLGLLIVDSQWYMGDWDLQPELNESCEMQSRGQFMGAVEDAAGDFAGKNLLVVAHHPLFSNGRQEDHFALRDNLYPPFERHPKRRAFLPVIGSVILAADKLSANRQEIDHPIYQEYIGGIEELARQHEGGIIYAAGHEHNLQLTVDKEISHIVSGAGSLTSPAKLGKDSKMAYAGRQGFAVLDFYQDGEAWVEFVRVKEKRSEVEDGIGAQGGKKGKRKKQDSSPDASPVHLTPEVFFRQKIKEPLPTPKEIIPKEFPEYKQRKDSVEVAILKKGDIWDMNNLLWGKLNTDYYYQKIKVPVLDLAEEAGGLKAFKKGGGFQTTSIRLKTDDGKHLYQIRAMRKSAEKLYYPLNKTFAKDVLEYSYTSANPFAAYMVTPMENAIGIYHTNPSLVYVPQQPRLGIYNEYGGVLFHFEERPDEDWHDLASFGNSKDIISTGKLLEERMKNDKAVIDQQMMLRCRLFDVIIGDWDRHQDQWRWASTPIKGTDRTLYQPIPRDRDQAFAKYGGLVFWAARLVVPQFRSTSIYDGKINKWEAKWLPWQARDVDAFFLNELTWQDWEKEVAHIQASLTDASTEQGMRWLPPGIYEKMAPTLIKNVKSRRDHLRQTARWWYENLAETVSVIATQKENLIEVDRLSDEETKVTIYEKTKDGDKQLIYERLFENKLTKEIRIFGLEGDDEFKVRGEVKRSPLIRLVGGVDEDRFDDDSKVSGLRRMTIVHDDLMEDNEVKPSGETKDRRMNDYDRNTWFFGNNPVNNVTGLPIIGYNPDEQLFLGANLKFARYGYRSANIHQLIGQVAFSTHGYYLRYVGDYQRALGKHDFLLEASVETPRYVNNFFGIGNETQRLDDPPNNYYRVRMERYIFSVAMKHQTDGGLFYAFGPLAKAVRVDRRAGSFLDGLETGIRPEVFDYQYFAGAQARLEYTNVDKKWNPGHGVDFQSNASWQANVESLAMNYANIGGYLGFYIPLDRLRWLVLATRVGGSHNFGKFDFYNAPSLGGSQSEHLGGHLTIRGYNSGRFTGRSVFYHNNDLRIRILDRVKLGMPVSLGIAPAFDYGRVWADGEESSTWHYSYGASIWAAPLDYAALTFGLMKTPEGQRFTATLGYEF